MSSYSNYSKDKPKLSPEEESEAREIKRRKEREEAQKNRIIFKLIYYKLPVASQIELGSRARAEGLRAASRLGYVLDGPEFGPPWGQYWSAVSVETTKAFTQIMTREYASRIMDAIDAEARGDRWASSPRSSRDARETTDETADETDGAPIMDHHVVNQTAGQFMQPTRSVAHERINEHEWEAGQ